MLTVAESVVDLLTVLQDVIYVMPESIIITVYWLLSTVVLVSNVDVMVVPAVVLIMLIMLIIMI